MSSILLRFLRPVSLFSFAFSCFFLLVGCSENSESPSSQPKATTLGVDVPSSGGAIFFGELSAFELVEDHGFVVSQDSAFSRYDDLHLSIGPPIRSGRFEFELATGLEKDKVYFYKAFIVSSGRVAYGETKTFHSNGSLPPVLEKIYPEKGYIGSTVQLQGKNFSGGNSYYSRVSLGEVEVHPIAVSDSSITIVIPSYIKSNKFTINVTVFDKSADGIPFEIYTPEIHSIVPSEATYRDIVTLKGQHFDSIPDGSVLLLGGERALVLSSSRTEIKFVVPDEFRSDRARVQLESQLQIVESSDYFSLRPPVITSFPNCTQSRAEFEILGANFHPIPYRNEVYFGGASAEVIGGDANGLRVIVPYGPFPDAKTKVAVKISETPVVHPSEICIEDDWVMITDRLPFTYYSGIGTFATEDRAFVFSDNKLWLYNPDNGEWGSQEIPFDISYGTGSTTYNGRKAYVYTADYKDNFWEYDPATGKWIKRRDFPGHIRWGAAMFSIGDKVYLGIGRYAPSVLSAEQPLHDFFRFDPDRNQWIEVQSLVTDQYRGRARMSSFVIGDNAYLVGGALTTGHYEAWKFDGRTEKWESIADMPQVVSYTSSFVYNGKGYITTAGGWGVDGKECFQYDPATDKWDLFYPVGHLGRYRGFAFTLRGVPYVGGGEQSFSSVNVTHQMHKLNK